MNKWLEFLGLWLSEGWTDKNGIGIAQSKPKTKKEVERIVSLLPFKWRRTKPEHICIYSVQLSNYLKQFGTATHKFVPSYVKTLSKKQISLFLNAYALGDASHDKYGGRTFWTSSKQMADDLQELIIKIGGVANLYQIPSRQSKIGNRIITPTVNFCYRVHQRSGRLLANIVYKKHLKIKSYSGLVYCVEVPNHILMIRRQGKPILCGNTARFLRQQNERLGEPKVRKSYPERGGFRKSMTLEERKLYLVEAFGLEIGKALVRDYPNIAAMTHEMGYGQLIRKEMTSETLINNIANIKLGSGRRVGPAKAKQIYEVCFT